jgi:hypothetical protein
MDETQQTNWYINVLSLLDRVLNSQRYYPSDYPHRFYTQLNSDSNHIHNC